MWASRSCTAKLTAVEPARCWSVNTWTHPPGTTCHSTSVDIGLLSAARPNSDSYQWRLLSKSAPGTAANTCSIAMFSPSIDLKGTDPRREPDSSRTGRRLQPGVLGGRGEEC